MIPNTLNPLGINKNLEAGGILGYAKNAEAFYDGLNNLGLGQHDTTAQYWADLTGHGYTLVKMADTILWRDGGGLTGDGTIASRGLQNNLLTLNSNFTVEVCIISDSNEEVPLWNNCSQVNSKFTGIESKLSINEWDTNVWNNGQRTNTEYFIYTNDDIWTLSVVYDGNTLKTIFNNNSYYQYSHIIIPNEILFSTPFKVNSNMRDGLSLRDIDSRICAVRVYHRALTEEELLNNSNLDKQRFNQ